MSHLREKYTRRLCPRISPRRRVTVRGQGRYRLKVPRWTPAFGAASRLGTGAARGERSGKPLVSSVMTGKQYRQTPAGTIAPIARPNKHCQRARHDVLLNLFTSSILHRQFSNPSSVVKLGQVISRRHSFFRMSNGSHTWSGVTPV